MEMFATVNSTDIKLAQLKIRLNHMHENASGLISLASIVEITGLLSLLLKFLCDTRDEPASKEAELRSLFIWSVIKVGYRIW